MRPPPLGWGLVVIHADRGRGVFRRSVMWATPSGKWLDYWVLWGSCRGHRVGLLAAFRVSGTGGLSHRLSQIPRVAPPSVSTTSAPGRNRIHSKCIQERTFTGKIRSRGQSPATMSESWRMRISPHPGVSGVTQRPRGPPFSCVISWQIPKPESGGVQAVPKLEWVAHPVAWLVMLTAHSHPPEVGHLPPPLSRYPVRVLVGHAGNTETASL